MLMKLENAVYITEYTRDDERKAQSNAPTGIWVTEDGHIYICEMDQGEIIEFDENYKFVRAIGDPNCIGLTVAYKPKRIAVDSVGRMYVLVNNCYEALLSWIRKETLTVMWVQLQLLFH